MIDDIVYISGGAQLGMWPEIKNDKKFIHFIATKYLEVLKNSKGLIYCPWWEYAIEDGIRGDGFREKKFRKKKYKILLSLYKENL